MAQLTNQNGELTWGGLVTAVQHIEDISSLSLTQYSKRAIISSRVFIENTLSDEEIMGPLMMNLMNIYTGFIMTATGMNAYINDTRTVRDAMSIVATESYNRDKSIYLEDKINDYFLGSKANLLAKDNKKFIIGLEHSIEPNSNMANPDADDTYTPGGFESPMGGQVVNPEPRDVTLPSGRIIEVSFGSDKNPNAFKVNLFLQLNPTFIPTEVASQFIGMNFSPSIKQRWLQASAGEISFIKDMILGLDQRRERMKALKKDKSGALRDMVERQQNALQNAWLKYLLITPERQNIANTILIFDKHNFDKACSKAGLRFKDYNKRQQFFNKTFSMMICTVDSLYNKIELFYNGLQTNSIFTFDQMKKNAKSEAMDIMSMMRDFSKAQSPRF